VPELPEMQVLSERLHALLSGAAFSGAFALQFSALKTFEPRPESLVGRELAGVGRRGKYLVFELGPDRILVHLSQGGRVFLEDTPGQRQARSGLGRAAGGARSGLGRAAEGARSGLGRAAEGARSGLGRAAEGARPKGGVVRLSFAGRPSVLVREFGSQRKAAWWVVGAGDDGPLAGLGPEPDSAAFEDLVLNGGDRRRIHNLLRDQRTVAGIGRGFTDDILWRARLSPYESLAALPPARRRELLETVRSVLDEGLARERRRTGGLPAKLGERFDIHGRYGHPCPRCGADLRRVSYESYEITYCPVCQTEGRTLADRRMSRLVK
jgi:formamidopyrimidine-DNA glycosylase